MNDNWIPPKRAYTDDEWAIIRRMSRSGMTTEEARRAMNDKTGVELSETAFRSRCDVRGIKFSRPLAHAGTSGLSMGKRNG
jgi:hypothetical protein